MSAPVQFELRWAAAADEPEIRALVGSIPMPGAVSVRFEREPDYFLGTTIMGDRCDVLIARQRTDGRLAAMGCRAEGRAFVNGEEGRIGYIGQLRVAEGFRGSWLIQRGARWFADAGAPELLYFGVIAAENPRARRFLTGGRAPGGVHVKRLCGITTFAIMLRRRQRRPVAGLDIQAATTTALPEVVAFLRQQGARLQLFPAYSLQDFVGGRRLRDLKPEDLMLARRAGHIVGVMAVWDQSGYKQDVIHEYGSSLRRIRPLYDRLAPFLGFAPLTSPAQAIPLAFASCICIANDDVSVMRLLLNACEQRALDRGKAFLMLGLADSDPLLKVAKRTIHITYRSDLYAASWSPECLSRLDGRVPRIEIATL